MGIPLELAGCQRPWRGVAFGFVGIPPELSRRRPAGSAAGLPPPQHKRPLYDIPASGNIAHPSYFDYPRKRPPGLDEKTSAAALFAAYEKVAGDANVYMQNLAAIKNNFKAHGYKLSSEDINRIEFVYQVFMRGGPGINYQFASASPAASTPSYTQIVTMADDKGHNWSHLAAEETFQYVRQMQQKNLFVPLVGNFAGPTTLRPLWGVSEGTQHECHRVLCIECRVLS